MGIREPSAGVSPTRQPLILMTTVAVTSEVPTTDHATNASPPGGRHRHRLYKYSTLISLRQPFDIGPSMCRSGRCKSRRRPGSNPASNPASFLERDVPAKFHDFPALFLLLSSFLASVRLVPV